MAELKITPGPWKTRIHINGDDCFVTANDVNGFAYDAEILGDDEYHDDFERKLADCNLVSSAPELYEELAENTELIGKLTVAIFQQDLYAAHELCGHLNIDFSENCSPKLVSKALNKARGEE